MISNYYLATDPSLPVLHRVIGCGASGTAVDPPLSIKCMFGGSARYETGAGSQHRVDAEHYLVLNRGQDYSFEKDATAPVETFCLFFPLTLVPSIAAQCTRSDAELLEWDPTSIPSFNHFEHRRPHRGRVSKQVHGLRDRLLANELDDGAVEEALIQLGTSLVLEHNSIQQRIAKLPYARKQTRNELYRRVQRARDFIHACYAKPVTLASAARAAAMSPFHFLRTFRQITGQTPLTYLQHVRLEQAARLLRETALPVSEIAVQVGYQSLGSFSTLFAKHTELPPTAYRRHARS